ncbi:NfeD family protein [Parasphingopyxis marina]|uniref:NfeD family protein n=1 Tax=Parasphingopyxis marina TaxID=2761622 RepID=A0A842HZT9_9SPHN|nr:NfeD family protein [Parasphingopyxis marina]MBC2777901.1 NfeD family protein [Parasphingopyxis marina]
MTIFGFEIDTEALWIVVGIILLCVEMMAPGMYLMFLGAAALFTGLLGYALPLSLPMELLIFAISSVGLVYVAKRWFEVYPILSTSPLLNARIAQMIGQTVTVVQPIEHGSGRVKVGDTVWSASGPDAPEGARMKITGAEGNCLEVEPLPALPEE